MTVKELYELACMYLVLPDMTRFVIGTFFTEDKWERFHADPDKYAENVFRQAANNGRLFTLKFHILRQKGIIDVTKPQHH